MLSTGKVDMMSWRSLEETMPYALQTVAKSFGIASGSMQDLYQKVQSGQISMKQLNDRFIDPPAPAPLGANGGAPGGGGGQWGRGGGERPGHVRP